MSLDRARTEDQLLSDLGIGHALRHQAQHLHLPLGQPIRIGWTRCCWGSRRGGWLRRGHRVLSGQSLLWGHGSSLGPHGSKTLLPQPCAFTGHRPPIENPPDIWPGGTPRFTPPPPPSHPPTPPRPLPPSHPPPPPP